MIESRDAVCGCKVIVTVDRLGGQIYDGISRVEIVEPCKLHGSADHSPPELEVPRLLDGDDLRNSVWTAPSIQCRQCGREHLVPVPRSALGVPFWAIPEHNTPFGGGRCLLSLNAAPEQFQEA
ncbi:MAG: hypothetical protein JWN75_243 [Candidatus Saccharibacteria bacterium]|nr:hypothetical protein [Candidatus Saccharibacteria bacterium]